MKLSTGPCTKKPDSPVKYQTPGNLNYLPTWASTRRNIRPQVHPRERRRTILTHNKVHCVGVHPLYSALNQRGLLDPIKPAYKPKSAECQWLWIICRQFWSQYLLLHRTCCDTQRRAGTAKPTRLVSASNWYYERICLPVKWQKKKRKDKTKHNHTNRCYAYN